MFDLIHLLLRRPGLGEPAWLKSLTVITFLIVALISIFFALRSRRFTSIQHRALQFFYWGQSLLLLGLALDKQSDYLNSLTSIGRIIALSEGWYNTRRSLQFDLILAIVFFGCLLFGWGCWRFRSILRQQWLSLLGAIYLLTYTAIRTVSLHDVDAFLSTHVLGLRRDTIFELGGVLFLFCSLLYVALYEKRSLALE